MAKGDDLLRAIEAVHAAGLDEDRWPAALASVARMFGARAATLEDFEKQPMGLRYFKAAGLPPQGETAYLDHYARNNSRARYALKNLSKRFLCDYELTDERTMDRDPYYTKYLGSIDLRYFLSGQISNTAARASAVTIQRTRRQGHVGRGDLERMGLLLPHVRQAYDVTTRLRATHSRAAALEEALGWLGDGVALLGRDGKVVYSNDAFRAIAQRGDGRRVVRGSIELSAAGVQTHLARALAELRRLADGSPDSVTAADFLIPRARGAPAYIASPRPLLHRESHGAAAILFLRDPLSRNSSATKMLTEMFGMTEAEASLAQALQTGLSPVGYARAQGISINTVYTHLRRIKDKTGCRRLSELVRMLNEVQVPLRIDGPPRIS